MRVLIVEDDRKLGPVLVREFATDSIAADLVATGREAIVRASATDYAEDVDAPVLMLTARDEVRDRVRGLDSGADDYLVKPFAFDELLARVRAMSRRGRIQRSVVLEIGDLRLDPARHQVWRGDTPIDLSRKQFALLQALMREPGAVLSRFDLLEQVWGYEYENRSNVIEVYIRYLRQKIDRPFGRNSLQTVPPRVRQPRHLPHRPQRLLPRGVPRHHQGQQHAGLPRPHDHGPHSHYRLGPRHRLGHSQSTGPRSPSRPHRSNSPDSQQPGTLIVRDLPICCTRRSASETPVTACRHRTVEAFAGRLPYARLDACWISSRVEHPSAAVTRQDGAADTATVSRPRSTAAAFVALVSLAVPSFAMASPPVPWGGTGANDLGPATILLSVAHGRVTVRNVQLVLSCTDAEDGTNFDQAWYASSDRPATLRLNRYTTTLTADAGGFAGRARLSGTLGSNGRGTSRIDVNAVAHNHNGETIARCAGLVNFRLRRP